MNFTENENYKKGLKGEERVISYFQKKNWKINDLRNDWYWRARDCDIEIIKGNKSFLFEVKTQNAIDYKNKIVIEMYNYTLNKCGWYYYSEADYFIFVSPAKEEAYIISAFNLKDLIENNRWLTEEYNSFSDCDVIYLDLEDIKNIYQKVIL